MSHRRHAAVVHGCRRVEDVKQDDWREAGEAIL